MKPSAGLVRRAVSTWVAMWIIFFFVASSTAEESKLSPCQIDYPSDATIAWHCHRLKSSESLENLFGDGWQDVARFNRIDRRHAVPGVRLKVPDHLEELEAFTPVPAQLDYDNLEEDPKYILIDLNEQYLGAYERGQLVFTTPITSGKSDYITPPGEFRITAYSRDHESSLYKVEDQDIPYPMHFALRFLVNQEGVEYWIHGRDLPGYPASHGCVGLYDEEMQRNNFGEPKYPLMDSARELYRWVVGSHEDDGEIHYLKQGPRVLIIGEPPGSTSSTKNSVPGP